MVVRPCILELAAVLELVRDDTRGEGSPRGDLERVLTDDRPDLEKPSLSRLVLVLVRFDRDVTRGPLTLVPYMELRLASDNSRLRRDTSLRLSILSISNILCS